MGANLKTRLVQLEAMAVHSPAKPMRFFRFDGTPEQAAQIAELNEQGVKTVTFTRAEEQTIE